MSQSTLKNFQYLFDRPAEPIFMPKGSKGDIVFSVPQSYLTTRYKPIANEIQNRFGSNNVIPIQESRSLPNLGLPMQLNRKSYFSVFNDFHQDCANNLITTLLNINTIEELQSVLVYAQPRINPFLYIYALSVVMLHRPDTRNIPIPSLVTTFPELYFQAPVLREAQSMASTMQDGYRTTIDVPQDLTATDNDVEHRLAYFREDLGANMCHWHWHMVYPSAGPATVMNKDRRGEIFYYMHQQMLARYNAERFSNNLPRVAPINDFRVPLAEGYFPKLDSKISSRVWASRQPNTPIVAVNRENDRTIVTVQDLERWRDRIYEAIQLQAIYRGTTLEPLRESDGIDVLGNLIEATQLSVNRSYYGNIHNMGHNVISFLHDPDGRFLEASGVMWDNNVAMRDPIFYRWHTTINNMFLAYKDSLTPYTAEQLTFNNVRITNIQLLTQYTPNGRQIENLLYTHWQKNQVDMSRGLDFIPRGPVNASFTHLQHEPFTIRVTVENSGGQREGTVRIFLAPKNDERGENFRFREQRMLFIELDRFTTQLRSGTNTIERRSVDSNVTIPFNVSFRNIDDVNFTTEDAAQNFVYCGCGWPDHLLIPKGLPGDGLKCDLFVMISDYQLDRVENSSINANGSGCDNAFAYCGVRSSRYPDRRHMGFPFDRLARSGALSLQQFLTPNMGVRDVSIKFEDRTTFGTTFRNANNANQNQQRIGTSNVNNQKRRP